MKLQNVYDFIDIIKSSFKKQFYTYILVAVLGAVFNYSLVFGYKIPAMFSGYLFVVFGSVGGSMFAYSVANDAWLNISHHWRAKEIPVLPPIQKLANQMGIKKFNLKVRADIKNAYAKGDDIVIGSSFFKTMPQKRLLALIAHEFQHLKGKHNLKITFWLYPVMVFACINYIALPKTILYISLLSATIVFRTPIAWYFELKADEAASKYVGSNEMVDALMHISTNHDRDEPSLTHPSINDRVKKFRESS